jgi:hypothetical protein
LVSSLQHGKIAGLYIIFSFTNGFSKAEEDNTWQQRLLILYYGLYFNAHRGKMLKAELEPTRRITYEGF